MTSISSWDSRQHPVALVERIYEAALDSTRWLPFMEDLGASLRASVGLLWIHDFSDGSAAFDNRGGSISAVTGLDAMALTSYTDYYSARNVWLPHASKLAEGSITTSSALYPETSLKGTEFYADWLRGLNAFHAVGSAIVKQGSRDMKMSFIRPERAGRYDDAELHLLRQLMPHLRNAVVLHRELYRLKVLSTSAIAALEMLPMGIILLTREGLLMHANRLAHELAAGTGALSFGTGGTLHAARTKGTETLQRLVQDAIRRGAGSGPGCGGTIRLTGSGGRELHLLVTPLPDGFSPLGDEAPAVIFCSDPKAPIALLSGRLETLYGMTPAEAKLTEALVVGQSLSEYADTRTVSINTVRSQLKAAAAKAGAKRQADLVRIVLTGPTLLNTR